MVQIGTQLPTQGSTQVRNDPTMDWLTLAECTFTTHYGITTPQVAAAAEAHARHQAAAEALAELRAELRSGSGARSTPGGTTPVSIQPRLPDMGPSPVEAAQPPATPLPNRPRGTGRDPMAAHGWLGIFDAEGNVDHNHATATDLAHRLATAAPDVVELWRHLPNQTRDAATVMAYIVTQVEAAGPTWKLGFPDIADDNAIESILKATGLIVTYTGQRGVLRWERP